MEGSNNELDGPLSKEQWEGLVKLTDQLTLSPTQRSDRVLEIIRKEIPDISLFDLWCFAVHILQSLAAQDPKIATSVGRINNLIYIMHYRLKIWKQL